jgi:hypothetical protein
MLHELALVHSGWRIQHATRLASTTDVCCSLGDGRRLITNLPEGVDDIVERAEEFALARFTRR